MSLSNQSFLKVTKDAIVDNTPIGNENSLIFTKNPVNFILNYSEEANIFYLSLDYGYLPYQWQWEELKEAIDEFYKRVDDKCITGINGEKEKSIKESNTSTPPDSEPPRKEPGFVYLLEGDGCYKIGKSKAPIKRRKTLAVKLPFEVELIHKVKTQNYTKLEEFLHHKFFDKRLNGEWFDLNQGDVKYIKNLEGDEY